MDAAMRRKIAERAAAQAAPKRSAGPSQALPAKKKKKASSSPPPSAAHKKKKGPSSVSIPGAAPPPGFTVETSAMSGLEVPAIQATDVSGPVLAVDTAVTTSAEEAAPSLIVGAPSSAGEAVTTEPDLQGAVDVASPSLAQPPSSSHPSSSSVAIPVGPKDTIYSVETALKYGQYMFTEADLQYARSIREEGNTFAGRMLQLGLQTALLARAEIERRIGFREEIRRLRKLLSEADTRARKQTEKAVADAEARLIAEKENVLRSLTEERLERQTQEDLATQAMSKSAEYRNEMEKAKDELRRERLSHKREVATLKEEMAKTSKEHEAAMAEVQEDRDEARALLESAQEYAVVKFKESAEYENALLDAAVPAFSGGMIEYRAALVQFYPDLDLSGLDEKYPNSLEPAAAEEPAETEDTTAEDASAEDTEDQVHIPTEAEQEAEDQAMGTLLEDEPSGSSRQEQE